MMKYNAYVFEIEKDNVYKVQILGVSNTVKGSMIDFEEALCAVIEHSLPFDFDYKFTREGLTKKGRKCREYEVRIDNGD